MGTLITHFPKEMAAFLGDVLPHVWNTLTQGADRYHKTVINYIEDADDPVDSDGKNCMKTVHYSKKEAVCRLYRGPFRILDFTC